MYLNMEVYSLIIILMTTFNEINAGSFQSYVETDLVGSGRLSQAAILGSDGSPWAESRGINLQPGAGEGKSIIELLENPATVFDTGVTVGGVTYMGVQGYDRSIYANKGPSGVLIVKTEETIIIGLYDKYQQIGKAIPIIEGLADYLIENGY